LHIVYSSTPEIGVKGGIQIAQQLHQWLQLKEYGLWRTVFMSAGLRNGLWLVTWYTSLLIVAV